MALQHISAAIADPPEALEATVIALKADARAGEHPLPLRGRNIGLLCDDPQRPEVFLLERTAGGLGAKVALVRPALDDVGMRLVAERTGRTLGLLYDALICVHMPAAVVKVLREASGIPAAADVAGVWAMLQARHPDAQEDERYTLQALVIEACA